MTREEIKILMILFNKISVMDEEDGLIDLEEFSFSMNLKNHSIMSISLFKALDTNKALPGSA